MVLCYNTDRDLKGDNHDFSKHLFLYNYMSGILDSIIMDYSVDSIKSMDHSFNCRSDIITVDSHT